MYLYKFSCYDNFVKSNMFGVLEYISDFGVFKYLYMLLVNVFNLIQNGMLFKNRSVWNKDCKVFNCEFNFFISNDG